MAQSLSAVQWFWSFPQVAQRLDSPRVLPSILARLTDLQNFCSVLLAVFVNLKAAARVALASCHLPAACCRLPVRRWQGADFSFSFVSSLALMQYDNCNKAKGNRVPNFVTPAGPTATPNEMYELTFSPFLLIFFFVFFFVSLHFYESRNRNQCGHKMPNAIWPKIRSFVVWNFFRF